MIETRTYTLQSQGDADKALAFSLPRNATLVGVEKAITEKSGTISAHTLDINEGTTARASGICSGAADDTVYRYESAHLGGADAAVELKKDTLHTIDINQTGSGNASVSITLYLLWSEV